MTKRANVAGQFYPGSPIRLKQDIVRMIDKADVKPYTEHIGVIMVPHAGYVYSGLTAAAGFKAASRTKYTTIVLLGPTHYYDFNGIALWPDGAFETPLGDVPVDAGFAQSLMSACPHITENRPVFQRDHVIEVELPFIQTLFPEASIVPMIMSRSAPMSTLESLADALHQTVKDRTDVLLVISSDQSHFHPDAHAREIDKRGLSALETMDIDALWQGHHNGHMEIDGFKEVITALLYAKKQGLDTAKIITYATSGDVTGDTDSVVGYAAAVMYKAE